MIDKAIYTTQRPAMAKYYRLLPLQGALFIDHYPNDELSIIRLFDQIHLLQQIAGSGIFIDQEQHISDIHDNASLVVW